MRGCLGSFAGELYFSAESTDLGRELFSMSSSSTTVAVAVARSDIRAGAEGSDVRGLFVDTASSLLYFKARSSAVCPACLPACLLVSLSLSLSLYSHAMDVDGRRLKKQPAAQCTTQLGSGMALRFWS